MRAGVSCLGRLGACTAPTFARPRGGSEAPHAARRAAAAAQPSLVVALAVVDQHLLAGRDVAHRVDLDPPLADAQRRVRRAIDASASADPLRYTNHSCAPNASLRIRQGRVEIYAMRDIAAGEEVLVDYGESHHEGRLRCRCGAPGCVGRL